MLNHDSAVESITVGRLLGVSDTVVLSDLDFVSRDWSAAIIGNNPRNLHLVTNDCCRRGKRFIRNLSNQDLQN